MTHVNKSLPSLIRGLLLASGIAASLGALQACNANPSDAGNQPEQARLKDKEKDPDRVCATVVVCGADGKLYGTPCEADDANVKWSMDLGSCQEGSVDPIVPRCGTGGPGKDSIVLVDPICQPECGIR